MTPWQVDPLSIFQPTESLALNHTPVSDFRVKVKVAHRDSLDQRNIIYTRFKIHRGTNCYEHN